MIFRKNPIPGEDIKRTMSMTDKRRELIEQSSAEPLVYEYGVNRLAKALHPGFIRAFIAEKEACGKDCFRIGLKAAEGRFPYFRAGQFISVSARVGTSFITRPYSIASSPKEALEGKMSIIVQSRGIFSSYLTKEAAVGEELLIGEPSGDFYHDDLRDRKKILAIAGGSGITPFLSMMKAIEEGSEDFDLTLLYGVRTREHIPFDPKSFRSDRIRIVIVLSEEEAEGCRHGLISADIISEYLDEDTRIFVCGPDALYAYIDEQLAGLSPDRITVRKERNCIGDREVEEAKTYRLKVHIRDEVYELAARNDETIITAIERAGIPAVVRCRSGVCGFCHSRVISGTYFVAAENDFRRAADRKFNYIHPCSTYPTADLEIEVPIFNIGGEKQ